MSVIVQWGRLLLATAIAAFGVEEFIFGHTLSAFMPAYATGSGGKAVTIVTAILFIAAAAIIALSKSRNYIAWFPCALFFILFLVFHLPALLKDTKNGGEWTVCFELIAIASGALLAVLYSKKSVEKRHVPESFIRISQIFFGVSLIIFSCLHFVYAAYIATLIPAWIPFPLFWSYFFGVAFLAAAISLLFKLYVRLASSLLAVVFFVWVIALHLPRCLKNPQTEAEWTSLFVAMAMGAAALLFSVSVKFSARVES